MSLMSWKDDYSVKVVEIDKQHMKLIDLINELHDAMKNGKTKEALKEILNELTAYSISHFATEEKYFEQFQYPETVRHKKEHSDFVSRVVDFQNKFAEGKVLLSIQILDFLKNWLLSHIQGTDKKYTSFMNDNGIH